MTRRSILSTLGALALVVVPSAAMAYNAEGYTTTVSDPTPASGAPFTVTTTGADAGDELTLTVTSNPTSIPNSAIQVAGTVALAKTANADGVATWTVTLNQAGTYTLTVTDSQSGALLGDEVVTVAAAPAGDSLSATGFDPLPLGLGAAGLVLVGGTAVLMVRRRRAAA